MAKCRSCTAKIEWAITENGNKMPIDPSPAGRDGNIIKTGRRIDGLPEIHVINSHDELEGTETRFTSHFATCPNAKAHRR